MAARSALNASLTPDLMEYVADCVASGRYRSASEVVREALRRFQDSDAGRSDATDAAFLVRFADRIAPLADPNSILAEAAFLLGSHLEADRAGCGIVSADGRAVRVAQDWVAGDMPSLTGTHLLDHFGVQKPATLRRGQIVRCDDVTEDLSVQDDPGRAARLEASALRAGMTVPLVKAGRLLAVFFVHQRTPRGWTDADEHLIGAVAERSWAALQRAEAERALARSEARFRAIFQTTGHFMGLLSVKGVVLEVNPAALAFFGVEAREIVGRPIWEARCWSEDANHGAREKLRRALTRAASGTPVDDSVELHGASGAPARVAFSVRPARDFDGTLSMLVIEGRALPARDDSAHLLMQSEARFRALADATPIMIWASDAAGNAIYCNARMLAFIGAPRKLTGQDWVDLVHPEDRAESVALRRQSLITGRDFEREHRLRRFDGVYRWVLARAVAVRDAGGAIETWVGTSVDVTDIVDARHVLKQSNEELEHLVAERTRALEDAARELAAEMRRREEMATTLVQSQKLDVMGRLTSGIVHDFNNILTAIGGSYSLLRNRTGSARMHEILDHGEMAVERARRLIGQLMEFVRQDTAAPKSLPIGTFLTEAADLLHHAAGAGVPCRFEVAPDVWPVLCDPFQLEVALLNLVVNARDAMEGSGEITIAARNLAGHERPPDVTAGDYVAIAVSDRGKGMPPEVVARAAEDFFTTKPKGEGTGLGLPMVHNFAARLGGAVRIESTPGMGTTVTIILPRALLVTGAEQGAESAPDHALHGDASILLVEDDESLRQIIAAFLRDSGYSVLACGNAETAMALVQTLTRLDLLLADAQLGGASATMLALRLRAEWPGLPVLFITGAAADPALAGEAVLEKPIVFSRLSRAILETLGRWSPPGAARDGLLGRLRTTALRQFYLNWQTAKPDLQTLPRLSALDPVRFGLGPHAVTVAVEAGEPPALRYVSVGSALARRLGRRLDGELIDGSEEDAVLGQLARAYRRCARLGAGVYQSARLDFGHGDAVHLERLVLPVSETGRSITHLVAIVVFDEAGGAEPAPMQEQSP